MKKYLLPAIIPIAGLLSVALSLNSCSKSSDTDKIITDPPMSTQKLLYRKNDGNTDTNELWSVNADGSNKHQISVTLPTGVSLQNEEMAKSFNNGQFFVFSTTTESRTVLSGVEAIYAAGIDGSYPTLVKQLAAGEDIAIQSVLYQ